MYYSPELDELDELELIEAKPRKRRKRKNPEPSVAIATPVLLLGLGYAAWVLYNQVTHKVWSFTPWKLAKRPLQLRRANPVKQNDYRAYDAAVEKMMAPAVSVVEQDMWRAPRHDALEKEVVSFITP